MAFDPKKATLRQARRAVEPNPEIVADVSLRHKSGAAIPSVRSVTELLDKLYPKDELYMDTDTGMMRLGDLEGAEALTELVRELEIITCLINWYPHRQMIHDVVTRRSRSPHAARLLSVPKDRPPADLTSWTRRMEDPVLADEALRLMIAGYTLRALEPGAKFDYATVIIGPQGVGKTTFQSTLLPGRSVAYRHNDARPMETSAQCERIDLEEASEELFGRDRFNTFKDRVTATQRGEDVKYVRGKQQMKARAVFAGSSNERYLMPPGLEGTRRIIPLVMRRDDTSLMPALPESVWQQLISEGLRRYDAGEPPVLSPEGVERQQAALAMVTRPDDDGEVMQHAIDELVRVQGYFQKVDIQDAVMEIDPALSRNPSFGYAWRRLRGDYRQVSMRVDGKVTKVFVPVEAVAAS